MYQLSLNKADQARYLSALVSPHRKRVRIYLLDLNHKFVTDATELFVSGQSDLDISADTDRRCALTLWDTDGDLGLDTGDANDGAMFADRMVQARHGIYTEALGRWVDVPVFTGPVTSMSRHGQQVELVAQGKEFFLNRPACRVLRVKKGTTKTAAIRSLLAQCGEKFLDIPNVGNSKLTSNLQVASTQPLWPVVQSLARSLGYRVFYDARGYASLAPLKQRSSYVFRGGDGGNLLSVPSLNYDIAEVYNVVAVTGAVPKGKKVPVFAQAVAPASHPLSPQRLARGGVKTFLGQRVEAEKITTVAEAKKLAESTLAKGLREAVDIEFNAIPNPLIEPYDNVQVRTPSYTFNFTIAKLTFPLSGDSGMSIGRHYMARGVKR